MVLKYPQVNYHILEICYNETIIRNVLILRLILEAVRSMDERNWHDDGQRR